MVCHSDMSLMWSLIVTSRISRFDHDGSNSIATTEQTTITQNISLHNNFYISGKKDKNPEHVQIATTKTNR